MFKVGDVVIVVSDEVSTLYKQIGIVCKIDVSEQIIIEDLSFSLPICVALAILGRENPVWFPEKDLKKVPIKKSILFKLGKLYA